MRNTNSTRPSEAATQSNGADSGGGFANWRTGNFGGDERPKGSARGNGAKNSLAAPEEPSMQQQSKPKTTCYGADLIIQDGEEKKVSKHAKRRANKKAKQAAADVEGGQEPNN